MRTTKKGGYLENEIVFSCKFGPFFVGNFATVEIAFIPDEHNHHFRVGVLPRLFEPPRQMVERVATGDVIH